MPKRPVPDDFMDMVPTMARHRLAEHYRTSYRVVSRWLHECGFPPMGGDGKPSHNRKPMPDDFPQIAPLMHRARLALHYRASSEQVSRWIQECGVEAARPPQTTFSITPTIGRGLRIRGERVGSMFDEAADVLRRFGPVFRCNERGAFDSDGAFWRAGWSILTPDELLERADRKRAKAA